MSKQSKFQVPAREINRKEIINAPYNPRVITPEAKKKLKKNLKDRGLMGGIVWNERNGHLVAGHQRLEQLDELEGTQDYTLRVDVVNLTDKEEKEQNIFMNNAKVQGSFDDDKLKLLALEINTDLAGLDNYDLNMLGLGTFEAPKELSLAGFDDEDEDPEKPDDEDYDGPSDEERELKKEAIKEKKRKSLEKLDNDVDEGDNYVILTFDTAQDKAEFMERFGFVASDKYVNGNEFSEMVERVE